MANPGPGEGAPIDVSGRGRTGSAVKPNLVHRLHGAPHGQRRVHDGPPCDRDVGLFVEEVERELVRDDALELPLEGLAPFGIDPTLADAMLDRLVHRAYQLKLKGESMRKRLWALTRTDHYGS